MGQWSSFCNFIIIILNMFNWLSLWALEQHSPIVVNIVELPCVTQLQTLIEIGEKKSQKKKGKTKINETKFHFKLQDNLKDYPYISYLNKLYELFKILYD